MWTWRSNRARCEHAAGRILIWPTHRRSALVSAAGSAGIALLDTGRIVPVLEDQ
jgi:hypothetical protein